MDQNKKKIKSSNFAAFEDLFRRNHKFLCMIALKHVNDQHIAEDIVQEFFINYWERNSLVEFHGNFEAYACRAVKNKCISWHRKQESTNRKLKSYEYLDSEDYVESSVDTLKNKEAMELHIFKLIDELPPERKKIFLMSTTGNYTYLQIADKLGISINTVKTQMVKAYAFLRERAGQFLYTCFFMFLIISLLCVSFVFFYFLNHPYGMYLRHVIEYGS